MDGVVGISTVRTVKHVAHVIEGFLVVLVAVVSHQGIGCLLGGHLVDGTIRGVAESAIRLPVAQQVRQNADAALGKAPRILLERS